MPIHKDDRILWFIVGVGLFFAYKGISEQLQRVRKLTEVTHDESQGRKLDEEAEDAVSQDTLSKLTNSSNNEIRAGSIRIICDRFLNSVTRYQLFADLSGDNPVKRDRALQSTTFLLRSSVVTGAFYNYWFLRALTRCLVHLLEEHKLPVNSKAGPPWKPSAIARNSPIRPPGRPQAEVKALHILSQVLGPCFHTAMEAGIVSNWLAKYPFPCALPENGSRRDLVLTLYRSWYNDDPIMFSILGVFLAHKEGREALAKAGYIVNKDWTGDDDEYPGDDDSFGDYDGDIIMHNAEDTAGGLPSFGPAPRRRPRRRQTAVDSEEEQAIRRRRREAMVLSDGGGPLGQENIIQREDTTNDSTEADPRPAFETNVEEQMARMREEVDSYFEHAPILDDHELLRNLQ